MFRVQIFALGMVADMLFGVVISDFAQAVSARPDQGRSLQLTRRSCRTSSSSSSSTNPTQVAITCHHLYVRLLPPCWDTVLFARPYLEDPLIFRGNTESFPGMSFSYAPDFIVSEVLNAIYFAIDSAHRSSANGNVPG